MWSKRLIVALAHVADISTMEFNVYSHILRFLRCDMNEKDIGARTINFNHQSSIINHKARASLMMRYPLLIPRYIISYRMYRMHTRLLRVV